MFRCAYIMFHIVSILCYYANRKGGEKMNEVGKKLKTLRKGRGFGG